MTGLEEAVTAAQMARLNLAGLAVAYSLGRDDFRFLIRLPVTVEHAFTEYLKHAKAVAIWLARDSMDCPWYRLPVEVRSDFLAAAHQLITDTPMPEIRHSSAPGTGD